MAPRRVPKVKVIIDGRVYKHGKKIIGKVSNKGRTPSNCRPKIMQLIVNRG